MKRLLIILSIFILSSPVYGGEPLTSKQHMTQIKAAASEKGPYASHERWPKGYFLISDNLPFLVGLSLYKPGNETIALSTEQRAAIHEVRNNTVPAVLAMAGKIKQKELELADKLVDQRIAPKNLYYLVDEIAAMRAELTKAHMDCIRSVQNIVTDEKQYEALLQHARRLADKHKKQLHRGKK
jgi:hypothetical protein